MASFVVTCTSGLCPSPFAGTYTEETTGLFKKDSYKITKDDGRESYTAKGPVGLYFTLSPSGTLNEFTGTETYNTIPNKTNNGIGKRQIKAVYIPADVPPAPPAAVPSPAGLGVERVPQPDPSTTKPDPAHAKVDNPEVPTEQKPSVPSGPPLTVPQTPASSSSSDPPPPPSSSSVQPSSSAPPPPSSLARGMPTSSIVAIVAACIVGVIMILMAGFYIYDSYDRKRTGDQRRTRHAQRRY